MYKKLLVMLLVVTFISSVVTVPTTFGNTRTVTSTENAVRIRSSVNTSNNDNVLGYANKGDTFPYVATTSDSIGRNWYEISFSGKKGFIIAEYSTLSAEQSTAPRVIEIEDQGKQGRVNADVGLRVRSTNSTSGTVLGLLAHNTPITYYEEKGDWLRIEYNGQTGWVSKNFIIQGEAATAPQPSTNAKYATTNQTVIMRREAKAGSAILAYVPANTRVSYSEIKSGWYQVVYNNENGWVSGNMLTAENQTPVVSNVEAPSLKNDGLGTATVKGNSNVIIRKTAGGDRLGILSSDAKVDFYAVEKGWFKIGLPSGYGYVSGSVLTANYNVPKEDQISSDIKHFLGKVHSGGVLVRSSGRSDANNILGALGHAQEIEVTGQENDWYTFTYQGKKAYTSIHHITRIKALSSNEEESTSSYAGIVNTASLHVRKGPSTSHTSLGLIRKGTEVQVKGKEGDWLKITHNGSDAYVHGDYITKKSDLAAKEKVSSITVSMMPEGMDSFVNELKRLTFTATGSDYAQYKVEHFTGGTWKEVRAYSTDNAYSFKPTAVGEYKLRIYAKGTYNTSEVMREITFTIKPRNINTLGITVPELYVNHNNILDLYSEGSPDARYQVNFKAGNGAWKGLQAFSSNDKVTFKPTTSGQYTIEVQAKDVNASATQKTETVSVTVLPRKVTDLQVTRFPESGAVKREEPLTIQGFTKGSPEAQYRFSVNGEVLQNYSTNDSFLWIPSSAGSYTIKVDAKDAVEGSVLSKSITATVSQEMGSAHYFTVDLLPSTAADFARDQMTKSSPQNQDASSGWSWRNATYNEVIREMDPLNILGFDYTKQVEDTFGTITVTVNGYNVRESNTTSSKSLGTVSSGTTFEALQLNNGWYMIQYKGQTGWIYRDGVSYQAQATNYYPVGQSIRIKPGVALNLRSAAGTHGRVLTTINAGSNNIYTVRGQNSGWYLINHSGTDGWISGDYVDRVTREMPSEWFQFLDLRQHTGASAEELNNTVLKNKGILSGQGAAFVEASKAYGVNEIYLIAHALLETGNGSSRLAKGMDVNGTTVYNMYGIGAFDADPLGGGSRTAYEQGWTTPEKAIVGGAKWIGERYVNNKTHDQNTLWKMRWNFESINHQYATDVGWARKQTHQMQNMYKELDRYSFRFIIPQFLPQ